MLGKAASEGSYKEYSNTSPMSGDPVNIPKNYKHYINFEGSSQNQQR